MHFQFESELFKIDMKYLFRFIMLTLLNWYPLVSSGQIRTVNGDIAKTKMGTTLIHEHILVDWIGADSTGYDRWDRSEVILRALPFLREAKNYGVETILDCTPAFLGRDPYILKELSNKTGLNILTNTGYYGAQNNKFIPKHAYNSSDVQLSELWIDEFKNGIDSSGVRPGFIKISVDRDGVLSEMHEKLIRAAALTHLETGLTIVSHTGPDVPAMAQIKVLMELGVSPNAFVWTHAQSGTLEGYLQAAKLGAWVSLDNVNNDSERISWYVTTLSELKKQKLLDHILISHDSGWYNVGQQNGGNFRGYTAIFTKLIPELKKNGWSQREVDVLLLENPKKAYGLAVRKLHKP